MNLYRDESSNPRTDAQRNLSGRTHYADDDTLRYFYARILTTKVFAEGLLFGLVESVALDPHNRSRGYRAVIFDVFGNTVLRSDMESARKTADAARKDLYGHGLDAIAVTREAIVRKEEQHRSEIAQLTRDLDAIYLRSQKVAA